MTVEAEFKNMDEKEILKSICLKIEEMKNNGLTETDEYKQLCDDWETLSQNWIEGNLLNDDTT